MTEPHHRREFVRHLALGASAGLIARPHPALADEGEDQDDPPKNAPAQPARSEVDARMDLILARYGDRLDDDARKAIRAEIEGLVRRGERLRQFELNNGDGPYPVFVPYREPLA